MKDMKLQDLLTATYLTSEFAIKVINATGFDPSVALLVKTIQDRRKKFFLRRMPTTKPHVPVRFFCPDSVIYGGANYWIKGKKMMEYAFARREASLSLEEIKRIEENDTMVRAPEAFPELYAEYPNDVLFENSRKMVRGILHGGRVKPFEGGLKDSMLVKSTKTSLNIINGIGMLGAHELIKIIGLTSVGPKGADILLLDLEHYRNAKNVE
jgi:hypothetical protein